MPKKSDEKQVRIVVLHRGWVVVGEVSTSAEEVLIENAALIRRWGTTNGLGQIASGGPTEKTVLDKSPPIRVHPLAIIKQIDCDGEKWADALRR